MELIKKYKVIVITVTVSLLSIFVFSRLVSSSGITDYFLKSVDEKKSNMLELTGAAAAISTAITLMPDDIASPVAEKIADTSTFFMFILCVLFIEEYILTLGGYAACIFFIPAGCVLLCLFSMFRKQLFKQLSFKVFIIAIALVAIVPTSLLASNAIENRFEDSIQETIAAAKAGTEEIEAYAEDEENKGLFSEIWGKIKGGVTGFRERAEKLLSQFVEAVAVLLVTNCVIPLIVAFLFVWLLKSLFAINRHERVVIDGKEIIE
ncbi:MAG: hypothetical protein HUJ72_12665 [Blautia sp.]|nr:hypothetical protein [Blautia sp.]